MQGIGKCKDKGLQYTGNPPSSDKYYIPSSQLKCVKGLILDKSNEACGVLKPGFDNKLAIFIDKFGPPGPRGQCTPKRHTKWIWHTHPKTSKSYPSAEDIAKSLKPHINKKTGEMTNYPYRQFIFTFWGIWEIVCRGQKQRLDKKATRYIHALVKYCVKDLYNATKGREPINSSELPDNFTDCMNRKIGKSLSSMFYIRFTPWNMIPRYGYVLY